MKKTKAVMKMLGWAKFSVLLMQLKFQSLCQQNSREDCVRHFDLAHFSELVPKHQLYCLQSFT